MAIPTVAAAFTLLHALSDSRQVKLLRVVDLFVFALILGALFHHTGNVYFVAALHFIRNQCLAARPLAPPPKQEKDNDARAA